MGYTNIQADVNFRRQVLNQDGLKYVTGPYTSYNQDDFRAFTAVTDCVVSCTSYVGDSLVGEVIPAGTTIYGLFSSITITSGNAILQLAGYSRISDLVNSYYNTAAQYGYYSEAQKCTSERLNPYLAGGLYDKASWLLIPSQVEEDFVRTFKPTDNSGSLSFTRASDATRTNAAGEIERTPWNLIAWSEMFSDASWLKTDATIGINTTIAPNGTLTADTINLTNVADSRVFQGVNTISSNAYTFSCFFKNISLTSGQTFLLRYNNGQSSPNNAIAIATIDLANASATYSMSGTSGTGFSGSASGAVVAVGGGWYRFSLTFTLGTAGGSSVGTIQIINSVARSFYAWGAQVVEGTDAKPYFPTTNRLDVPRLDYRNADGTVNSCPRLLLEPQRTNSIRNSTMVGAVAGSPGTFPTNWGIANAGGLSTSVISVGTENGLSYVDLRISGTAIGSVYQLRHEANNNIIASVGQVWTATSYLKKIAEPAPPLSYRAYISDNNSAGSELAGSASGPFGVTTSLQRFTHTRTLTNALTERVVFSFLTTITIGATYDFTIRIAAPQMELGAYATTFIPTTTAAVTRLADASFKTGISLLIGQAEGTVFLDLNYETISGLAMFLSIRPNTTNKIEVYRDGQVIYGDILGGGTSIVITRTASAAGRYKIALAYKSGQTALYVNGTSAGTSTTAFSFAVSMADLFINLRSGPTFVEQTLYNQAALFPTRLSNEELALITTI
jgi:hypothetical protein